MTDAQRIRELPVFPLRNAVLLPFILAPFSAGRASSIAALEAAVSSEDKLVAVVTQREAETEAPEREELYEVGTVAVIKRLARSERNIEVLLQGVERITLKDLDTSGDYLKGQVETWPLPEDDTVKTQALERELLSLAGQYQEIAQTSLKLDLRNLNEQMQHPMQLTYVLTSMTGLEVSKAQRILATDTREAAMRDLYDTLLQEYQIQKLRKEIAGQAQSEMGKEQREYLLRQQLRAIQQELGEGNPDESDVAELRRRVDETELPEAVAKEVNRELGRMESIPPSSPERQVLRSYLELVLELPWTHETEDHLDLEHARNVLDEDHYGLDDVKDRILEHLAVLKLNPDAQAPILCFVGPPGVGKTSLGQSIARAIGRQFERFSLGGLHDEAELRGHRRTYVGAMPGRIIQALRRAGAKNPVLMLDEVDKLGRDFRGDPASALLEILDPAQNVNFRDNYLDLQFDLSKTFFICTANSLDPIPRPLLDRMEVIRLSGYSAEEKEVIADRYLIERQRTRAGLTEEQFEIPSQTLRAIIARYTREAGVRELERQIGRLARKVALKIAQASEHSPAETGDISVEALQDLLGPERFFQEQARKVLPPGVATGLAWTETGGDVLYIEAILLGDDDSLLLTGQLGDVMKESARAAQNYVLSRHEQLGIERPKRGVHVHVPAGAIPKDGPSAGVAVAAALASLYTGHPVDRNVAMTGEITLTGLVLPVGGVKEKVLAARRAGIERVILPKQNEKDTRELPKEVSSEIEILFAEHIDDVLKACIPDLRQQLAHAAA